MSLLGSNTSLKGTLGWKGERGFSAYEIAVQHGFIGTEQDWLATLGTSSYFSKDVIVHTSTAGQTEFALPDEYTSSSIVDVYVNGFKLTTNEYTLDAENEEVVLEDELEAGAYVEIIAWTMSTNNLPIVTTINSSSTNLTVPGTKAVYDYINSIETRLAEIEATLNNE